MTLEYYIPIIVRKDKWYCAFNCPWLIHKRNPKKLFCALTREPVPNYKRTQRCKYATKKYWIQTEGELRKHRTEAIDIDIRF